MAASEFPIEGDKLKKLVKRARRQPINFGYNPGTDDDDQFLAAHIKKQPQLMGKIAKTDGAGTKSAFGTFTVSGNILTLQCERELPQLAKRMKKLMRMNKISLNVQVMDSAGNLIDSDVEEFAPGAAFEEADDDDDNDDIGDDTGTAAPEAPQDRNAAAQDAPPAPDPDRAKALATRLRQLPPQLAAAPAPVAEKLNKAFQTAVGLTKAGQMDKADQTITQIEGVLARLPAPAADQSAPENAGQPAADPRLPKLRDAVERIATQIETLPEVAAAPLSAELHTVNAQIDAGEAETALTGLRNVQTALKTTLAEQARWMKAMQTLEPKVTAALPSRTAAGDDDLRVKWNYATALGGDGAFVRAIAALKPVVDALKAAPAPAADNGDAATARDTGVVAFQKSRILWVGARQKMLAEAQALADAVAAQGADDEDAAEIRAAGDEIVAQVKRVDERLQDVLDQITTADPGRPRNALKARAAGIVSEYQNMLSTGIFATIDQNPIKPVSVAAPARAALGVIARTLA